MPRSDHGVWTPYSPPSSVMLALAIVSLTEPREISGVDRKARACGVTPPAVKMFHGTHAAAVASPGVTTVARQTGVPAATPGTPPTAGLAMTSSAMFSRRIEKSLRNACEKRVVPY